MDRRLVGFDARLESMEDLRTLWLDQRRTEYLLRPEIAWPLSVDRSVWPSAFRYRWQEPPEPSYPIIEFDDEDEDWLNQGDWLNLERMLERYEAHQGRKPLCTFIAIQLFHEQPVEDAGYSEVIGYHTRFGPHAIEVPVTDPVQPPAQCTFLGFDVADASRISGLSNCGYRPDEARSWQSYWASRLNQNGLLETIDDAIEFKNRTDERVAEHAPFWIFGLSVLPRGQHPTLLAT